MTKSSQRKSRPSPARGARRVHWLQHAPHEGLGSIGPWLRARGFRVSQSRLFAGDRLPPARAFDWLIVMGGPMNIYQHDRYPWLVPEKELINDACVTKKVLGICLGSQLMADVLGAQVTKNAEDEIGWFKVHLREPALSSSIFGSFPSTFDAFHWHGDTFSIPKGAINLMSSEACAHQAFEIGGRLVAMQFHPEVRRTDARRWLAVDPPQPARYVQDAAHILNVPGRYSANNRLMRRVLERMEAQ